MGDEPPTPTRETAYDLDALRAAYGHVPVFERTFEVEDASEHAGDSAAWDVPGGGRENGESVEATAVREVHEEVALAVRLDDAAVAHRLTFDDGDRAATGVWTHFTATVADPVPLDVQTEELADATWRTTRPDDVDDFLERALDAIANPDNSA